MNGHGHRYTEDEAAAMFEPPSWEERYSGEEKIWSGNPNPQLVAEVSGLAPGTALDVGCGEGGDVIWLAQQGWTVTGADFSANGLARAARHAADAGVADRTDWWQVDARTFSADGRSYDLVTTHFLHPPDGGMVEVTRRLADAVAPGGHLLIVGHAPSEAFDFLTASHRRAMFFAEDLLPGLPDGFEALVVEQRPRTMTRDGETVDVHDSTLLARRASRRCADEDSRFTRPIVVTGGQRRCWAARHPIATASSASNAPPTAAQRSHQTIPTASAATGIGTSQSPARRTAAGRGSTGSLLR